MRRAAILAAICAFGAAGLASVAAGPTAGASSANTQARGPAKIDVSAFSAQPGAEGVPEPWSLFVRAGKADFSLESDQGEPAVRFRCDRSSFGFQRKLDVDLEQYPLLSWKWKAPKLPAGADWRKAETDDQAAQLWVAFDATHVIGYLWDSSAPLESSGDAAIRPPFIGIKVLVLRSGPDQADRWSSESRDLIADYRALFGSSPAGLRAKGLRIYINSQHTGSYAESAFADIAFSGREP